MPKRVHASAFDLELVEDRPKAVLDNFIRCIGSPVAIEEEKALGIRSPRRQIFFQHRDERFRHRYELNNAYKTMLEEAGLVFCGMTPDRRIMQILDYPTHPFFVATQFHPELLSRPLRPHPLFLEFVRAAKRHQAS